MLEKIKNIISETDRFFYKKFGSDKGTKILENIKEARIIFSHLNDVGKEDRVRFVGGCVRKAICGEIIDDIDLATSLEPEQIKKRLSKEEIRLIDTGIAHGTVTAILNKKKFEITTLRKDVLTDGRHANVTFTSNWEEDALRRDFTINAIYADIEGRIFDPLNGMSDLKKGKIKFIGATEQRIQEDYLRILRYFRFFIQYSKEDHDRNIIKLIKKNINGINILSNERLFDELIKILSLDNINSLFSNKISKEIILEIFPQLQYYEKLKIIENLDKKLKNNYNYILILALLIIDKSNNYEYFCHKYKVSNNIKNRFKNILLNFENIKRKNFFSKTNTKKLIYLSSRDYVKDLLLFSLCSSNEVKNYDVEKLLNYINHCEIPKFPISGDYLKDRGYKSGKKLGKKLKSLEEEWIKNNFIIEEKIIKKSTSKVIKN